MNRLRVAVLLVVTAALLGGGLRATAQDSEDHEYSGEDVYRLFCVLCHGPRGQGSPIGKMLNAGEALGLSDDDIIRMVYEGRPEKGMMGFGTGLTRVEIVRVMEYVRELQGRAVQRRARVQDSASATPKGNVKLGEALFTGKAGCIQCHSYYTRGGMIGPALDAVASRLSEEAIREAISKPGESIVPFFGAKEIVTKRGDTLRGRYRYETEQTIQLLNAEATIWTTHFKDDLRSVPEEETTLMPEGLLTKLSADEQTALLDFLQTLK